MGLRRACVMHLRRSFRRAQRGGALPRRRGRAVHPPPAAPSPRGGPGVGCLGKKDGRTGRARGASSRQPSRPRTSATHPTQAKLRTHVHRRAAQRPTWCSPAILSNSSTHTTPRSPPQHTHTDTHACLHIDACIQGVPHLVLAGHLVELVDAHHPAIAQHDGARLKHRVAGDGVAHHADGQARAWRGG